jgi:Uri superfamily endonuclease
VDDNKEPTAIRHEKQLKELLNAHYRNFSFKILRGNAEEELAKELGRKKNMIATYGALGRNNISRFFRKSSEDKILEAVDIPLFITHP